MDHPDRNADESVTLINVFDVPDGKLEETIAMWTRARDYLKTQPGFVSTALQRAVGPDARFQLVNIATWTSAEAFQAATRSMYAHADVPEVADLQFHPGLYRTWLT